jgi:Tfp pilus assembly protein PilO
MNENRKKLLVGCMVAVVGLILAYQLWTRLVVQPRVTFEKKKGQWIALARKTKRQNINAERQISHLESYRDRSLPANVQTALTLYQGWLIQLAEQVGLENRKVDCGSPVARQGYKTIPFVVRGYGTMDQLTHFLFTFYRAPHLHRIRSMQVTPIAAGTRLSLSFSIDALVVDGCKRADELATGAANVLASAKLEDYRIIAQRNLLGGSSVAEVAELTELTAVMAVDGRPEAWFINRMDDRLQKLQVGGRLEAGWFGGEVVEIIQDDVILEVNGERWLLTRGDRLSDAEPLPPEY